MLSEGGVHMFVRHLFRNSRSRSKSLQWSPWRQKSSTSSTPPPQVDPEVVAQTPLTKPLPGLPTPIYATLKEYEQETKVTTLPNGLRVASENRFGQFCTVGVVIDSGSRYEVAYPSGISHFLEKLAFSSTSEFVDRDKILHELEKHGGICDCQSSRDTFIYAASVNSRGLDPALRVLGDVVLRPQITEPELIDVQQAISFELSDLEMRPDQEPILVDMIHGAAYRDNTLGLPKLCPDDNITKIDRTLLFTFLKQHYAPERMVLAGVGVDHDALLESANKYFVEKPAIWMEDPSLIIQDRVLEVDHSVAQYTGGIVQEECDPITNLGPTPLPELAHLVVGLESCSHQDPDFIAVCVLNMMMGGGGSFSAGGPGKGMYTRLYTNVLNRYHWMYNATAYNHAYIDSGLFCIHASAPPAQLRELSEVIVRELVAMTSGVAQAELERAKKQLQSMLLMNLEARPVVFEDIGRQVLATGHRKRPEHYIDEIDRITADDVQRIARRLLRSPPSVAARGDIRRLPTLADFQSGILDREGRLPGRGRLSLFR